MNATTLSAIRSLEESSKDCAVASDNSISSVGSATVGAAETPSVSMLISSRNLEEIIVGAGDEPAGPDI